MAVIKLMQAIIDSNLCCARDQKCRLLGRHKVRSRGGVPLARKTTLAVLRLTGDAGSSTLDS